MRIWRGDARFRRRSSYYDGKRLYAPGQVLPRGVQIAPEREAQMIADGRIEVVDERPSAAPVVPAPVPAPVRPPAPAPKPEPGPESAPEALEVSVEVGCMEATIEAGPDGKLGTADDIRKIAPVRRKNPARGKSKTSGKGKNSSRRKKG